MYNAYEITKTKSLYLVSPTGWAHAPKDVIGSFYFAENGITKDEINWIYSEDELKALKQKFDAKYKKI